jgi:hypothetical protein
MSSVFLNSKQQKIMQKYLTEIDIARRRAILMSVILFICIVGIGCRLAKDKDSNQIPSDELTLISSEESFIYKTERINVSSVHSVSVTVNVPSSTGTETPEPQHSRPTETSQLPTRFAVIGDYGLSKDPELDVANLVKSWKPEFIITVGDNNYPDGEEETIDENIGQYYHDYIHPYVGKYGTGSEINRFYPTLGNHDLTTLGGQPYFDYFTLPGNERYYDFIWGNVHLFALNSDSREPDGVGRSSIQAQWLNQKLAASSSTWKIVYMHHPPYSSSGDGSISWAQWPYGEWGADAVLSGHSHVYERLIVDEFPYFINGLGGGPKYEFNLPIAGSKIRFRDDYGAMLVEAYIDQIVFKFITRENAIIDTYSLYK